MADEEKAEQPGGVQDAGENLGSAGQGTGATASDQGCPVEMYEGRPCGRPIYPAPPGVDEGRVCLMHSKDPDKDDTEFQAEFERIIRATQERVADFTKFVFPGLDYSRKGFSAKCLFAGAVFLKSAKFVGAEFAKDAIFSGATFMENAEFRLATFMERANFGGAVFDAEAYFDGAEFTQLADFFRATFTQAAGFRDATFTQDAVFTMATFTQASFIQSVFRDRAFFNGAMFAGDARFYGATFWKAAIFIGTKFARAAQFGHVTFVDDVVFRAAQFRGDERLKDAEDGKLPGPVFSLARFEKPEAVVFYKAYLGQALFYTCDVSRFQFSSIRWRERSNGKRMVFEEAVDLGEARANNLRPHSNSPDERNYTLIAELYQQLKKNYDDRRDYWTAGDFHYGEMEMKRLATPPAGRIARWLVRRGVNEKRINRVRQWWHRNIGVAAWYKRASEYGESYGRPVAWLAAIVLLFTLLYPLAGLTPGAEQGNRAAVGQGSGDAVAAPKLNYWTLSEFVAAEQTGWAPGTLRFFGHSLMTTVGVAFFQRDLEYQPVYPWGRVLAWTQLLLTYTLVALFLLALRRQFRR